MESKVDAVRKYPDENLLSKEKSPYLLQHANNPVHWYPWGDDAFAKAKAEDKPVFLSIGYSTCHWCHVMEHESFENPKIAEVMNKYFVSIKVDREERPDVDNIYMKAVMSLTGSGGWPLSVFVTADRKPFYGGTYFPPDSQWGRPGFKELLLSINDAWQNKRDELIKSSHLISQNLQSKSFWGQIAGNPMLDEGTLRSAYGQFAQRFDSRHGGFGGAPKFPSSHNLSYLLRYWKRANEPKALEMVEKTLTEMSKGGMYDHIGGGFHRYSTDQRWHIPHFEKMMYDQAILTKTYLEAYQATKVEKYAQTTREILEYVLRDMTDTKGGFYSAEDADSLPPEKFANMTPAEGLSGEKTEGAFYLWRYQEIVELLGKEVAEVFNYYYGVESRGNAFSDPHGEFRGKNILYVSHSLDETAQKFGKPAREIQKILNESRNKLLDVRKFRPRPHLDDKILVDWNGLMISSLALGSRVLNEPRYGQAAEKSAQFILSTLVRKDGRLLHRYRDGEAGILGTLEDYAFFIHGLIDLYEATFKEEYLKEAKRLTEDMIKLFWHEKEGGFFFTATDAERLLIREKEIYDGAIPSGNSIAALDLLRMGRLTLNREWEKKAQEYFKAFGQELSSGPSAYAQSLMALDFAIGPSREIVLVGQKDDPQTQEMLKSLYSRFIPNKVVVLRLNSDEEAKAISDIIPFVKGQRALDGKTTAYVCKNYNCEFPTNDIKKFEQLLDR
ncbi:MAG: thioredoxin domain-containing protein [Candidatus Omnitrophica bacterium]|nr:thioredoxin domain-containing protein [Candidatus Omnitrophota bacterium]